MGRSWHYPPWRRVVMQVTMWLIFASTLGVAALVVHEKKSVKPVSLAPATTINGVTVRMPAGWDVSPGVAESPRSPILAAREDGRRGGRMIAVYRQDVPDLIAPEEFLARYVMDAADEFAVRLSDDLPGDPGPWPIKMGSFPGLMIRKVSEMKISFIACAVLPSREAITVRLDSHGDAPGKDERAMVEGVAASVMTGRLPTLSRPESFAMRGGVSVRRPAGMSLVDEKDPHRTSRTLLLDDADHWLAVQLLPCVLLGDRGEREGMILPVLSQHNINWYTATLAAEEKQANQWRVVRPAEADEAFPPRAYVLADAGGSAVLAIFQGGLGENKRFDAVWQQLAAGVKFEASPDYASLQAAGASEVARLAKTGLGESAGEIRNDQWWLWQDRGGKSIGWTRSQFVAGPNLRCSGETRWRQRDRTAIRLAQQWVSSDDLRSYQLDAIWSEATAADERSAAIIGQHSVLNRGKLATELVLHGHPVSRVSTNAGGNFLPGGAATLLAGKLLRRPMMVSCESMLAFGWSPTDRAIAVTIEPAGDRELLVEFNGSGELQRWTFDDRGQAISVRMADGVKGERASEEKITSVFASDARLRP